MHTTVIDISKTTKWEYSENCILLLPVSLFLFPQTGHLGLFLLSLFRDIICMYKHVSFYASSIYHAHCSLFCLFP